MKQMLMIAGLLSAMTVAHAKLPAPVLDDAAKAKAEEAKAKTAHAGKVDAYLLCKSMDRTAAHYFKSSKATGKSVPTAQASPACVDPGAFGAPAPAVAAAGSAAPAKAAGPAAATPKAKKS